MKRTLTFGVAVLIAVLAVGAGVALAQAPALEPVPGRVDVFGGYSYQRLNSASGSGTNLNGWAAEAQTNIKSSFALVAAFSGAYGSQLGADLQLYTFLAGPRLIYRKGRANIFAHALLGGANLNATAGGVGDNSSGFATALGGGVDVHLTHRAAVRLFQTDYLLTRIAGNTQNNFRLSAGLVFHAGRKPGQ